MPLTRRAMLLSLGPALCASGSGRAATESPGELAQLYRASVDRRLQLPRREVEFYALRAEAALARAGRVPDAPQYLLVVDRDPRVQAALLMWRAPGGEYRLVGASPVSTGHPGPFDRHPTPVGAFALAQEQAAAAAFDFGWQPVGRDWGDGSARRMRLLVRPPAEPVLERRLGLAQSDGSILVPATLAQLMLAMRLLPQDSPAALVVLESGRAERPAWSPAPYVPLVRPPAPALPPGTR